MVGYKLLKSYVSSAITAVLTGLWNDRGNFDASVNAYPSSGGSGTAGAILKGDIWTISVAGTLPTGLVVEAGDTVRALTNTPGNTQANWAIAQNNIGYTPENITNKDTDGTLSANSDTKYPSQKATKTYADTKEASANKDASGGYAGLTLFKINMRNVANTFTSYFTNANTASRTYTLPDRDADISAFSLEAMVDADKTFTAGKTIMSLTTALTATRALTLPAANAFPAGTKLIFVDTIRGVSIGNNITITRAGSDTVNGATTLAFNIIGGTVELITDGTSKWIATFGAPYSISQLKSLAADVLTSVNTAADVTGLLYTLKANKKYRVRGFLSIGCDATGGVKFAANVTGTGATWTIQWSGRTSTNALTGYGTTQNVTTLNGTAFSTQVSTGGQVFVNGTITMGSTDGAFQLQFASGTNTQTSTVFSEGTSMEVTEIS